MITTKRRAGAVAVLALTAGAIFAGQQSATADIAPQDKDVLAVGSDIQQNAFNFLADGYGELPGYNSAGNKWRFFNLDSAGDDNGKSSYLPDHYTNGDPSAGIDNTAAGKPVVFNPTTILRAGRPNVTRPSGGGGGLGALIANDQDTGALIDVARSPNLPTAQQQTDAGNHGSRLYSVRVGLDRDLIAVSSDSHLPAKISGSDILKIYEGTIHTVGELTNNSTSPYKDETLHPLYLPTSAGMQKIFFNELARIKGSNPSISSSIPVVQQNDPTTITRLPDGTRETALVPFPRGRYTLLDSGYYAAGPTPTGTYQTGTRSSLTVAGIKLLDGDSSGQNANSFGVDFPYNAVFRKTDYQSTEPWQPGSTLNWVKALFYNPNGPAPFVDTDAGRALLEKAGITPDYGVTLDN